MNTQRLLGLVFLIGAFGFPLGLNTGSTSLDKAGAGQPVTNGQQEPNPATPAISFDVLGYTSATMVVPLDGSGIGKCPITVINSSTSFSIPRNAWSGYVTVHDDSGVAWKKSDILVTVIPRDDDEESLDPNTSREFVVEFTLHENLPRFDNLQSYAAQSLSGYLFLRADKNVIKGIPLQLVTSNPSPRAKWLILAGLIGAVVICSICGVLLHDRLTKPITIPDWGTGSLVTNLTLVGTVITGLASAWAIIKQPHLLQNAEYVVLSGLFGGLVIIAPLAFYFIRFTKRRTSADDVSKTGYVWLFLVACVFTLWGAMSQSLLIYYYLDEFARAHLLSQGGLLVFAGAMIVLGILLILYAIHTIYSIASQTPVEGSPPTGAEVGKACSFDPNCDEGNSDSSMIRDAPRDCGGARTLESPRRNIGPITCP